MPTLPGPDYFLAVELLVATENCAEFEDRMSTLLRQGTVFSGWWLRLALRTVEPFPYTGSERYQAGGIETTGSGVPTGTGADKKYHRYVHLWDLPEPVEIAEKMRSLGESIEYIRLNKLVEREIQDVLFTVQTDGLPRPRKKCPVDEKRLFVRAQRKFSSDKLGTYLISAIAGAVTIDALTQWRCRGFLRHATGPLNFMTEFYETDASDVDSGPHLASRFADVLQEGMAEAKRRGVAPLSADDFENLTSNMHLDVRYALRATSYAEHAQTEQHAPSVGAHKSWGRS